MSLSDLQKVFSKSAWPVVLVVCVLVGGAWLAVGAVGKFTDMVDKRAEAVVKTASIVPFEQHKDFERRISQNEVDIKAIIKSAQEQGRVLDRLVDREEQRQLASRTVPTRPPRVLR